jgi:hypothetical protein
MSHRDDVSMILDALRRDRLFNARPSSNIGWIALLRFLGRSTIADNQSSDTFISWGERRYKWQEVLLMTSFWGREGEEPGRWAGEQLG